MAGIKGQFASQSRMRASDIDSKFHSYGISAAPSDTGLSPANKRSVNLIDRIFFIKNFYQCRTYLANQTYK